MHFRSVAHAQLHPSRKRETVVPFFAYVKSSLRKCHFEPSGSSSPSAFWLLTCIKDGLPRKLVYSQSILRYSRVQLISPWQKQTRHILQSSILGGRISKICCWAECWHQMLVKLLDDVLWFKIECSNDSFRVGLCSRELSEIFEICIWSHCLCLFVGFLDLSPLKVTSYGKEGSWDDNHKTANAAYSDVAAD